MDIRTKSVKARKGAPVTPVGEQSAFLRNILESSTEYSIIGKDLTGRIELWNAGARRIYGYEPEEVIGYVGCASRTRPLLARRLAELHGGTIDVECEAGKGSTFRLRLPT